MRSNRAGPRQRQKWSGFTLVEVLLVVVIMGVLSVVVVDTGLREWRREQTNALTLQLAGWLETVRRAALRGSNCTATLNTGILSTGAQVASANASGCLSNAPLVVDPSHDNMSFNLSSTASTVTFTPRGTISSEVDPIIITVSLQPSGPSRCINISGLLGLIRIGNPAAGNCSADQRF
ncbi:MAG: prepilin-type N-terminal cleavage/methylation domain-containing protein [Cyanobacteriota bacterium]|nr:prepilin-type N-terminal cleavage/methylation domain-containing protein [Cyanobacteriota bacterium]